MTTPRFRPPTAGVASRAYLRLHTATADLGMLHAPHWSIAHSLCCRCSMCPAAVCLHTSPLLSLLSLLPPPSCRYCQCPRCTLPFHAP
ncbi:hypothetical protein BU25DRAFT_46935 [Macroventuria anomochaeta]|uniref:Uncharacterized protein n=1 Tax=Macroventuria anomochaeta TaxID=301207 RepID=A0ACB6S1V2_9PLEO|nr:uncharacterized protein BU25DRAFT_46935 [Macroventuria anomochaeta]KAF2627947.1 hypothetical protein BU25DRAFT_46935 [Macroventuria anomochaeta]